MKFVKKSNGIFGKSKYVKLELHPESRKIYADVKKVLIDIYGEDFLKNEDPRIPVVCGDDSVSRMRYALKDKLNNTEITSSELIELGSKVGELFKLSKRFLFPHNIRRALDLFDIKPKEQKLIDDLPSSDKLIIEEMRKLTHFIDFTNSFFNVNKQELKRREKEKKQTLKRKLKSFNKPVSRRTYKVKF
jgi:hypothetical protein